MASVKASWDNLMTELRQISERGSKEPDHFLTITNLFDRIPELVLYDDAPEPKTNLVHYTTWKNVQNMFSMDRGSPMLRMYNYEQSNDPHEGQIRLPEWEEVLRDANWLDEFLKRSSRWTEDMKFGGTTYGCSFSSGPSGVEDDLTYWRLYGNDGQGCSLKISVPYAENVYKVRYRGKDFNDRSQPEKEEDEQVAGRLRALFEVGKETVDRAPDSYRSIVRETVAEGLLQILYGYYHLVKHTAYAGEHEWRMIAVMPWRDRIRYDTTSENLVRRYIEGPPLSQLLSTDSVITIGPTVLNRGAARAYLEHLVREKHRIRYATVQTSDKTYRQSPSLKLT